MTVLSRMILALSSWKSMGETPLRAICSECYTKFFTPPDLIDSPRKAEWHLLDQFASHKCKVNSVDAA